MTDNFNVSDPLCCEGGGGVKQSFAAVGRNPDVDSGTDEDIWAGGGDYPFNAIDAATEIVSSSANDAAAGTGAQTVTVVGLSGGLLTQETVSMNGLTIVPLVNQYSRCFVTEALTAGSIGSNDGTITIQQTAGPLTLGQILPGVGNVLNGIFTIPDDWNPVTLKALGGSIGKQAASFFSIILQFRSGPNGGWTTGGIIDVNTQGSGVFNIAAPGQRVGSITFQPGDDIRLRTSGSATINNGATGYFTVEET